MYQRKKLIPLRDAIFLHLEPYSSRANPYVMPDPTCQEVMSVMLSASRGNLSRVMRELVTSGHVKELRAHVSTGKLRRKTYVLTEVGMREARELRRRTGESMVRLKDERGVMKDVKLREIPRELRNGSTLLEIALNTTRGVFDKVAYIENLRKRNPFVCVEARRPKGTSFFGREKELDAITKWFRSKKKILEVKGIAGIGKTALVARAFTDLKNETNALWLAINEETSIESLMEDIAAFLRLLGKAKLDTFLKYRREDQEQDTLEVVSGGDIIEPRKDGFKRRDEFLYTLGRELEGVKALVVFDGCERAREEVSQFIGLLIGRMRDHAGLKIILSGRDISRIRGIKDWRKTGLTQALNVGKLDFESSKKILQLKGVEIWRFKDVYKQTGGLPFFLELVGPSYDSQATDVDTYLEEEVLSQLTLDEERVLGFVSVFREPVHSDAFFQWKSMKFETIRSLIEKSLLTEVSPMVYDTHDILKQSANRKLSTRKQKLYHRRAANHYLEEGDVEDVLKAAYHLISAGDKIEAGHILAEHGTDIISKGRARELFELLQKLETEKKLMDVPELAFLRGECLSMRGLWDDALQEYDQSLLLSENKGDQAGVSWALRRIAEIQLMRGHYDEVLEPLNRSAAIAKKLDDYLGLTECYYDIASTLWAKGKIQESQSYVKESLRIAKQSKDNAAIARAYKAQGILNDELGRRKRGLASKRMAVRYARKSNDLALLSTCLINLSNSYYIKEEDGESLRLAEEGLKVAEELGSARDMALSFSNLSSLYIVKEDYKRAKEFADKAYEICQDLREMGLLAQLYLRYAYIYEEKDWKKAESYLDKCLKVVDQFSNPADRCMFYANIGHLRLWRAKEKGLPPDKKGLACIEEAKSCLEMVKEAPRRGELKAQITKALEHGPAER